MSKNEFLSFNVNAIKLRSFTHSAVFNNLTMTLLKTIRENNKMCLKLIEELEHEIKSVQHDIIAQKKLELLKQNKELFIKVEAKRTQLIALEVRHGKQQIPVPGARGLCTANNVILNVIPEKSQNARKFEEVITSTTEALKESAKKKKPKKDKCVNALQKQSGNASVELPIDVARLDMRVGKIIQIERHPDAENLYVEKIDCGEAQPRTVVSGLVQFVPLEEMQNRMVIVLCNLKPAKMRGISSEAMVMCALTPNKVEVLSPPEGAFPGDTIHCQGYARQPDAQLNPKKKIFETCMPDLKTNDALVACYKDVELYIPGKGPIKAQTLKNVYVK